jgi:tetratricopeptide (TPR) repeat protein
VPPESPRIAELRRRVHADPASIAFAQLAEEYRRAGSYADAVKYCRNGLARHPGYLSARVTLGRALIELGDIDDAVHEFELVLKSAPDNLAAIRGMAEIQQRRGDLQGALDYYKRALSLARFDPDLEETVSRIGREMGSVTQSTDGGGLSFEEAHSELLSAAFRVPVVPPAPMPAPPVSPPSEPPPSEPPSSEPTASAAAENLREAATIEPVAPPVATQTTTAGDRVEPLMDFDALLKSFGVADAAPPAIMEMLVSGSSAPAARPQELLSKAPPPAAADSFAALERELRAFAGPAAPTPTPTIAAGADAAVAAVIAELEAWLRVLTLERASQSA